MIGTVILFGFLILALSLYQVQVVPQENAQVEFQHFEDVRNDLVDLRAGVLQAGSTDRPQYQTVRLGTTYPSRVFTINPPSPAGTLQTTESYPVVISNGTPEGTVTVPTRFLQYRPGYNEIDQSSTWYDASVLYVDARDRGSGIAVIEDQELVSGDGEVRIVALQNEFRRSGTGRVTLELRPAESVTETLPEGDLTVTVPTRLSEGDWETKTDLPTDSEVYGGVTDDTNGDGVYNLTLNTTADDLTVDTVGVQEAPEDPTQNTDGAVGSGGGGGDGGDGDSGSDGGDGPTQASGIVSNDDASTFWGTSGVQFSVRNDGSGVAEIESISIDSTTSQAEVLKEQNGGAGAGQREIYVASSSSEGFHEAGDTGQDRYFIGTQVTLSSDVGIATDDDATITLAFFQTDGAGGSGDRVDMTGEDIDITLYFADGSQKSLVISVPN
ncbi:hypothetical protein [Halorubrum sp. CSM-61]|uniref:hypothetical protein n=1 Tax=Halorubrum sp. CSM-61 TaxID=2485838 RepID=UPI000F4D05FE|nr:hypothetical protein [Halorubrum sp. CSM-61]